MAHTIKCFQITLTGKLRGRGLRFSTMYMAFPLNITGFVEYTGSGGIMIEAEGVEEDLEQFISGLRSLVLAFKISDISISETAPKGYSSFEIRYSYYGEELHAHQSFTTKLLNSFSMRMRRMFGSKKPQDL